MLVHAGQMLAWRLAGLISWLVRYASMSIAESTFWLDRQLGMSSANVCQRRGPMPWCFISLLITFLYCNLGLPTGRFPSVNNNRGRTFEGGHLTLAARAQTIVVVCVWECCSVVLNCNVSESQGWGVVPAISRYESYVGSGGENCPFCRSSPGLWTIQ